MPTIDKALGLLDHFSGTAPEIGLAEFRELSGFDKATVHRYLTTLRQCGYVEQNPDNKAYRLGPALIRLATVREKTVPLKRIAAPLLGALADQIGELVHAALPQQTGMSSLYAKDGGHGSTRVDFDESEVLPLHATSSGLAFLAFGPVEFFQSVISKALPAYTFATPNTSEKVKSLVSNSKKAGYAYAEQLYESEVCSVAVPFFNIAGTAIGTLAIATPRSRMNRNMYAKKLADTSQRFTRQLGGSVPDDLLEIWNSL